MIDCKNKKILVLGGASFHLKLINAAHELGAYVIVTDNLPYEKSPGKQTADEYWDINIYDIQEIVNNAKNVGVEAVISGWLDPCQRPYAEICKELDLPCYGTPEQFFKMTDKHAFKEMCRQCGVDTIAEYTVESVMEDRAEYPLFIKPVDSRGSRGQSVCYNKEEALKAIEFAKSESSNGDILIEKYIRGSQEFHATYFFVDGEPYLLRTSDNYCGSEKMHMDKVVSCAVMPSSHTAQYLSEAHPRVVEMFKKLGVKYGPIFMQGFYDDGKFKFFDPGLRFPGVDYELVYKKVFGTDLMKAMVQIAFTGKCDITIPKDGVWIDGKRASVLYLTVKAGHISTISGEDTVKANPNVISYLPRCKEGDTIEWNYTVNQRLAEIDLLAQSTEELIETIKFVNNSITALDENGNDLVFSRFDTSRVK